MKRSPKINPLAGDVFAYARWHITVRNRDGGRVYYNAVNLDTGAAKEGEQTVEEWGKWAARSKVMKRAESAEECCFTLSAAGPCGKCGEYQAKGAHVTDAGVFCAAHCPMQKHGKGK